MMDHIKQKIRTIPDFPKPGVLFRWQQVGDCVRNRVAYITLGAVKGTGYYLSLVLLVNRKLKLPFAHRTDQNIHQLFLHGLIIAYPGSCGNTLFSSDSPIPCVPFPRGEGEMKKRGASAPL